MKKLILLFLAPLLAFAAPTQPITNGVVPNGGTLVVQSGGALSATGTGTIVATSATGNAATATTAAGLTGTPNISVGTIAASTGTFTGIMGFGGATPSATTSAIFPASTTGVSSFRVPAGSAPTSPVDGDFWTTTSGVFARINGSTVGPFGVAGGSTAFSSITGATNTTAAMVVGTGASLGSSGSGTITATAVPVGGISGLGTGVGTALAIAVGSAGGPVTNGGALGTPSSGTVTNLTGTASININGTVGATTPAAGTFTTGVFGSTTSLLLGTAGSAVGNIGFRNATSGTATLAPPTGALGTYSVTLPNAASTLPIFGQQTTFSGPTAARTITLLDAAYTTARQDAAQTFTGVQSFTSPDITTSITTPSTSFTAFAGATTLMTIGGTGASASSFFPSTLDTTTSTTGAIRTSGGISAAKALNIGTTITGGGNLTIGTSNSATVGTIELGAATDTTISRSAAAVIAVEGNIVSMVGPRITAITSSATPTFDVRTCDVVSITALAANITSMTSSMTITGVLDFQQLEFRIIDNGTPRTISWGANFVAGPAALPTTTITSKALRTFFEYDSVKAKFVCINSNSDL